MPQIFTFTVSDPEGMHARPAGRLVAKAGLKVSSLLLSRRNDTVPLVQVIECISIVKIETSCFRMRWIINMIAV